MSNIKNKMITTLLAGGMLLKSIFPTDFYNVNKNIPYTYGYNTSVINELAPNFLDNKHKQLLVYSGKYNNNDDISKMDSQQLIDGLEKSFLDVYLNVEQKGNNINLKYYNNGLGNLSLREKQRLGNLESYFREMPNNTQLYLALPPGVVFTKNEQNLYIKNAQNGTIKIQKATPPEDTIGYKLACDVNDILEIWNEEDLEKYGQSDNAPLNILTQFKGTSISSIVKKVQTGVENKFFKHVDTSGAYVSLLRKVPGFIGELISASITLGSSLEEIIERRNVNKISKTFGEEYEIDRIEIYTEDGFNTIRDILVGREINLGLSKKEDYKGDEVYLIIPNIVFENKNVKDQTSKLEDLTFSFKL